MRATAFDSLAAARELKAAGVEGNQAEVLAEWMREASVVNRDDFATKGDIAALEARLKAEFKTLRAEYKADIASAANRMTFTMIVALGVLFAALKLF